jgi:hypothetical protein
LELVPGRDRSELEQGSISIRIPIAEVRDVVVPGDLEQTLLDPMVEPGPSEDELLEPVDK